MTTTVFMNGRSQAVRLPKEFRLPGDRVSVRRLGTGVLLEPIAAPTWPDGYFEEIMISDDSFKRPGQGAMPPVAPLDA
jgi:virulence-associated protein VagC